MAGETLVDLVEVMDKLKLTKALKKVFGVLKEMLVSKGGKDVGSFVKTLSLRGDVYAKYQGFWGKTILKPDLISNELVLHEWVCLTSIFLDNFKDIRANVHLTKNIIVVLKLGKHFASFQSNNHLS